MVIRKVLVVEDEKMFREFLVIWLKGAGLEVVGEADSLAAANALSESVEMDLVLLDLDLPDGDGLRYVDWQLARRPNTRIMVLTAHASNYPVIKLKRSIVMAVLDKKETSGVELQKAFRALEQSRTYYSDSIEEAFMKLVREPEAFYKTLSPREEQMVKLFGQGLSNEEIATDLGLSVATVQGHRRNVMAKVGVRSTPELIIWAIQNGFVRGRQIGRLDSVGGKR
ncbi:MAG: response regulator transcription factor [Puniceicoccaceae bacterium]